jgi:hypothetical protein
MQFVLDQQLFALIAPLRQVSIASERIETLCKFCECLRGHIAMLAAMKKQLLKIAGVHAGRVPKRITARFR